MRLTPAAALLAFVAGCGSKDTGPNSEPVGSVVINIAPTAPVLVGTTVQLGATALNSSGGTISGASITWQTSDALLATVSPGGLVTALGAGMVTITAKADGKTASVQLDLRGGGTINQAGGSLPVLNGAVTLTVPPGGVAQSVNFLIRPVPDPVASPRIVPGTIFELTPETSPFTALATLTLRYDVSRLPSGILEPSLQLYVLTPSGWSPIYASTFNAATKTVSGNIFLTGLFAVGGAGVASVSLGGLAFEGGLYPGQTGQLAATVLDDLGRQITGFPVTWSTSDPSRATVAAGTVTGVAPGTVTITAQVQGKSATTTLAILPRPVADWSQATTEWSTHQGNPDHTGFVAAILDPMVFSVKWTRSPFGNGIGLHPATFGPGNVFVSSASYFGVQKLTTLDIATGQPRWTKDFGGIHGVHPPAYGNGSVYVTTSGHQDSFLWAFDPATGAQQFKSTYGNQWSIYYAPVIVGQRVYMAGGSTDGMYAFDATSGAQAWFFQTAQFNEWTPAVRSGVAYTYTGQPAAQVEAVDAVTGTLLYQVADPHFTFSTYSMNTAPVLGAQQDLLVTQSGRLVSFDLGARAVRWEILSEFQGTVAVAADQLYVINSGKVDARREDTGALLWSWTPPLAEPLENSLLVSRNLLFAASQHTTYAIDLTVHRQVWSYPAGGHLSLSPQGVLLIAGSDGAVSAVTVR